MLPCVLHYIWKDTLRPFKEITVCSQHRKQHSSRNRCYDFKIYEVGASWCIFVSRAMGTWCIKSWFHNINVKLPSFMAKEINISFIGEHLDHTYVYV